MPVNPDTLPGARGLGSGIEQDRPCLRCGYNLVGLETEGRCPECGTPITRRRAGDPFSDTLVNAPTRYLETLLIGLGLMAGAILLTWGQWILEWVGFLKPVISAWVSLGLALMWCAAAWIATVRRPQTDRTRPDDILDSRRLRLWTRAAQGLCVAGSLLAVAHGSTGLVAFGVLSGLATVGFLFSLAPLGVYLSSLADWAGETGVGSRLRASAWCIACCGTLLVVSTLVLMIPGLRFKLLFAVGTTIFSIGVMAGLVLLCASILQLVNTTVWAIANAHQSRAREIRIAERKRRQAEQVAARADEATAAMAAVSNPHLEAALAGDDPIPIEGLDEPAAAPPEPARPGPVGRRQEFNPYDLADGA